MQLYNLVLSGGGVRSYAHIGFYKYCFENNIHFNEIVCVSGGSILAPFIYLRKNPEYLESIFKKEKIHKNLFPFWFVPDKFEFLLYEPSSIKLGEWVEKYFSKEELNKIYKEKKLHIMATLFPNKKEKVKSVDVLSIADLKNSIAASSAISGIFKQHKIGNNIYIDGGHWNNCPLFFDFQNSSLPLIVVNLGYAGLLDKEGGRISKIIKGLEVSSFSRFKEELIRWDFEKKCGQRGNLISITPNVWNINSLNFNLSDFEINNLITTAYKATSLVLNAEKILV